jgi:hypothetical protein
VSADPDRVRILRNRFTIVWRDENPDSGRIVVATREDDTTVILKWLAEGAGGDSGAGF